MTFYELKNKLETIANGELLEFDLSNINAVISSELDDFFKIENNILHLFNARINEINDQVISFFGEIRLKRSNVYFEVNITLLNHSKLDYIITVEPNGNWMDKVNDKIKNVLNFLPVGFGETLFIHSSIDIENASISFDENKIYEVVITKGNSVATHIKSELLKILNLSDTLFFISKAQDGMYKIFKEVEFNVDLAGILDIDISRINILNKETLSVDGKLSIPFPDNNELNLDCSVSVSKENFHTRIKPENEIRLPVQDILKGLEMGNLELDFYGSFVNPADHIFGMAGNFAVGEPVKLKTEHDFTYQTLKSNEFNVKFSPTKSSYIPVFLQAYIDEISFSKGITLLTGKEMKLPDFLDPIKLYSVFLYYCAPGQTNSLINGIQSKKGVAVSSGIRILGFDSYCELSALDNRITGNIILEPVNLANLVKIEGDSQGTPSSYKGPKIEKGGVQLFFDSQGPVYFRTDVSVNLFDIFKFKTGANVQESGLQFYYDLDLGIAKAQCDFLLNSINDFQFHSQFEATLAGLKADLGSLGKLSVDLSIFSEVDFAIKLRATDGNASVKVGFLFNGTKQSLSFSIDIKNLNNIEKYIREEILKALEKLILTPLDWLAAILDGAIEIAEDILEEAAAIAKNLEREFGQTIHQAGELLKNAGYEAEKTARILLNGFTDSAKEAAEVLKNAKYTTDQIAKALVNVTENTAVEIFKLLKGINEPIGKIGEALRAFSSELEGAIQNLQLSEKDAAALLKGLGKSVEEQARILKDVLKISKDLTDTALRTVGNAANEVTHAINAVFGGGGGGTPGIHISIGGKHGGLGVRVGSWKF